MALYNPYNAAIRELWQKIHDSTDTYKVAFYPSTTAFAVGDALRSYNDYAGELTGGAIPAGGVTLDNFTVTDTAVDHDDESIAANAANPSNVRTLLYYNDTSPGKEGIGFVTYTGDQDLVPGGLIQAPTGILALETTP